jgi:hypothetical protein
MAIRAGDRYHPRYPDVAMRPYFLRRDRQDDMRIPDEIVNSVFFIGTKSEGTFRPRATVFLVMAPDGDFDYLNLVTAEHVITYLFNKQAEGAKGFEKIVLRMNGKDGADPVERETRFDEWRFHPDEHKRTDVAVMAFDLPAWSGVDAIHTPSHMLLTEESIAATKVGVGDEVSIIGLFRSHYGVGKNIPIVRTGNIAAMADEPIYTKYAGYIGAHLIEARSIGGLSGSPVWVHVLPEGGNSRLLELKGTKDRIFLLGLMHGHFDVKNLAEDAVADDAMEDAMMGTAGINTGIGIVVPAQKILETINHPDLKAMRTKSMRWMRETKGATADLDLSEAKESAPSTTADNPSHKEDFTALLGAAAKKRPQAD